ncbi:serine hydrolase [Spirochaetia bacterium]|nr:serine hydrolase [Spirochaetia bacterium]
MDSGSYVKAVEGLKVEGLIVMRHGKRIAEHRWIPEAPRNVFSVSKSFTSIAVGMAVDEGKLSLGDKVLEAFPGMVKDPSPRLKALTLEQLLTMTRGHGEFSRPNSVEEALNQDLVHEPGELFIYDNGSTFLASAMFTRAAGKTVRDYLVEKLFRPLGIPDPEWEESDDGYTRGATGLRISTSSMALFGQFLLQRGEWQGKQLVSAGWIDSAGRAQVTTKDSHHADYDLGYGYCFWPCRHGAYRADGKDGQFVIVLPRQDVVIAINSDEENMKPILYAVWDHLLPGL